MRKLKEIIERGTKHPLVVKMVMSWENENPYFFNIGLNGKFLKKKVHKL